MKNKKKKSVFLAGLMVFMMMVSLLSGINLGVVKAEETETKPNNLFDTAGKTFTLIKEWDTDPEEGTEAEFIVRAKYSDKNGEMTEVTPSAIVLTLDKEKSFYDTKASKDKTKTKTIWTTEIPFEEKFQDKTVMLTIEEKESKVYTSKPAEAQKISDKAEIKFTNTRVKRGLTIEKQWKDGEEKAAVTFDIKVNGKDAPKVLVNGDDKDDKWEKTLYLPVYDKDGNAIEYTVTEENKDISKTEKLVDKDEAVDKRVIFGETEPANGGRSVVPAVPSTPTVPEAIPVIPVSDATPTVTVPDDATPQGDANVSNGNTKAETTDEDTDNNEDVDDNDNNDKDVVDVDEDDIPQGEAKVKKDTSKEAPVKVEEDVTPKGSANLPKTGGTVGGFLSIIGMGLIGLALAIRKRK